MPVFRATDKFPDWCELEKFEFIELADGERRTLTRERDKEELYVCRGRAVVTVGDVECTLSEGGKFDINGPGVQEVSVRAQWGDALVFRAMGRWGSINGSGVFTAEAADPPKHDTPYDYEKATGFDNHYHDCDEYWIFFEGECVAVSEGKFYDVGPGDCVATGMGWHHDVVGIKGDGPIRAVWFEGTLEGQKRSGHLWEPEHGKAEPMADRV